MMPSPISGVFSASLARNSERIDHIMAGLDNLAGGPDGKGDIPEAVRSFKQLADNLDKRTAEITVGINRLTSTGTKQIELLVTDGRRTLNNIDQAVTDLAHNPQRIIFGGGSNAPAPAAPAPSRALGRERPREEATQRPIHSGHAEMLGPPRSDASGSVVIAREGAQSSNRRLLVRRPKIGVYWMPRLRAA